MKKVLFKLSCLFIITLLVISLTNCKKGTGLENNKNFPILDYYICGLYFEVVKTDSKPTLDYPDPNVKVYFNYTDEVFYASSGNTGYYIRKTDQRRNVSEEKDVIKITLLCNFTFPNIFTESQLRAYLICQNKDGKFFVDTENSKTAIINKGRCSFNTTFTNQKQKYQFSISIGLYKE